jgi:flagellin-specific chaperone FliS
MTTPPGPGLYEASPGMMSPPITDTDPSAKLISRKPPEPGEAREALVKRWQSRVREARTYWKPAFERMRASMSFVNGDQWETDTRRRRKRRRDAERDERYVANIALRHVLQRTAELYPQNPTVKAKSRPKIMATVWDGSMASLQQAQMGMQQALTAGPAGMRSAMQANAILQDVQMVKQYDQLMDRIARTLEILYQYNIEEQTHSFKTMMKMTVRRAIVTSVGYVKLGFQRAMKMDPAIEARIADMSERLANIERLAQDMADGEFEHDSADAEALGLAVKALQAEPQLIVREGLSFDYPDSTSIIPDKKCRTLRGFLGSDWVAQQYILTPDEIQEVYGVDIGHGYAVYDDNGETNEGVVNRHYDAGGRDSDSVQGHACVWEIYHRKDGLVYVVCDGYCDFLQEPTSPDVEISRFYPWFAFVLNEGYDENVLFPQSDIDLIRDMQLELNRARQGLREHRRANRPKTVVAAGVLEETDKDKLRTHPANAVLELNALAPGQKIDDVLQVVKNPPIDPAVYDTAPTFEDMLRVLGSDQADQGTTSNATATEVSVAQFSQHTDVSSVTDDMNDMLTDMARAGGEILMLNVSAQVVKEIVGPGAVWPEIDRQTIAKNVYLEVDAGGDGAPNKAQDVQNIVQLAPILQRVPGISPEWLARQIIQRMGADLDLTDAFAEGMPSIEALNQLMSSPQPGPGQAPGEADEGAPQGAGKGPPRPADPAQDPSAQGPQGLTNAVEGPSTAGGLGPRVPPLQVFGRNGNRPGTGGGMPRMRASSQGMPTP